MDTQKLSAVRSFAPRFQLLCALHGQQLGGGYWFTVETGTVKRAISNERLARAGFFDLSLAYESIQSACVGRAVYRTVRTVR